MQHQFVSAFAVMEPLSDAGDRCGAGAGFLGYGAVGDFFIHHFRNCETLGHAFEFVEGAEIAEKVFTLVGVFQLENSFVERFEFFRIVFFAFHSVLAF